MKRVADVAFCMVVAALFLCFGVTRAQAQAQSPATPSPSQAQAADKDKGKDADKEKEDEEGSNPFAPEPAPALPPGMTGSDPSDPRAKLSPGMYDAGEAAMGLKHLLLVKKPARQRLEKRRPESASIVVAVRRPTSATGSRQSPIAGCPRRG